MLYVTGRLFFFFFKKATPVTTYTLLLFIFQNSKEWGGEKNSLAHFSFLYKRNPSAARSQAEVTENNNEKQNAIYFHLFSLPSKCDLISADKQ